MTVLLPTRVSIYDFLIEDTQPIDSLIADIGRVSLPQARILIVNGIQAIVSALLAFNQAQGSEAVLKKLFMRSQVKELRKHNAFNFNTVATALQYGQTVSDVLFHKNETQKAVCEHLAQLSDLTPSKVKPILSVLSVLCVRELAILSDFSQLNASEIATWLEQQPQFFKLPRQSTLNEAPTDVNTDTNTQSSLYQIPYFDDIWHSVTGYQPPAINSQTKQDSMPHYAKVIGRTRHTHNNSTNNVLGPKVVDNANHSDVLTFESISGISLPYQRWLLQLAKIADIYLSRCRLKIAPEPIKPPTRPLVSFGFMEEKTVSTASETPIEYEKIPPLWRNPVLIFLVIVIGGLGLLAIGKYQYKKYEAAKPLPEASPIAENHNSKDIAIVKVHDEDPAH